MADDLRNLTATQAVRLIHAGKLRPEALISTSLPGGDGGPGCLVTPAGPGEAAKGLRWTGNPAFNFIWTSLHVPCVTVPAGTGPHGLHLGIQIVGRRGDDRSTLARARWVEAVIS